jgi:hypothetical protein
MSTGRKHRQYLARAYAMGGSTTVPAGDTVQVLADLSQRMSYSAIGRALGTSHNYVSRVITGEIKRMQPARHAAIMALADYQPADRSRITARGTARRLQALHALGYSWARLERELGFYSLSGIKRIIYGDRPTITATHAVAVAETYERLSMRLPQAADQYEAAGISRSRNHARALGWPPPLAWDDIDRDERPSGHEPESTTTMHRGDLAEEWAHLLAGGTSEHEAARQLGLSLKSIERSLLRASHDGQVA